MQEPQTLLDYALLYQQMNWNPIPVKFKSKEPVQTWKQFVNRPVSLEAVQYWFSAYHGKRNLAIVLGYSNLLDLDFDYPGTFAEWSKAYPDIAKRCAIIQSARGFHCLLTLKEPIKGSNIDYSFNGQIVEARLNHSLCTLPPSIHASGHEYSWVIAPWDIELIEIDNLEILGLKRVNNHE